jgi:hypothetical protein
MKTTLNLENDQSKLEMEIRIWKKFAMTFVLFGLLAGLYGWCSARGDTTPDLMTRLSSLGSYLQGTVGSLWALAGVILIYVAFLGQRLQLIKQDIEMVKQDAQILEQNNQMAKQQFESGFFQLLTLQSGIVASMHDGFFNYRAAALGNSNLVQKETGRHLFEKWYSQFRTQLNDPMDLVDLIVPMVNETDNNKRLELKRSYVMKQYESF